MPGPFGTVGVMGAWPGSFEAPAAASRVPADLSPPPVMMRARVAARVNSPEASAAMTLACCGKVWCRSLSSSWRAASLRGTGTPTLCPATERLAGATIRTGEAPGLFRGVMSTKPERT